LFSPYNRKKYIWNERKEKKNLKREKIKGKDLKMKKINKEEDLLVFRSNPKNQYPSNVNRLVCRTKRGTHTNKVRKTWKL